MEWTDVAGPPGVGKSTLCDVIWTPHDIPIEDIAPPPDWHDFCNEVTRLLSLVKDHWSFVPAVRMNRRSMRKMAVVASKTAFSIPREGISQIPYIQTGFTQRGLGFGWRLHDIGLPMDELRHFFRLMPVSIGVVFLEADPDTIEARNRDREKVKETAHENREQMVRKMLPAIELAKECLDARNVPVETISTEQDIDKARQQLLDFADRGPCDEAQAGRGSQMAAVSAPPVWW